MAYGKRTQTVWRPAPILIAAALIVFVLYVLRDPELSQQVRAITGQTERSSSAAKPQTEKPPATAAAKTIKPVRSHIKQPGRTRTAPDIVQDGQNDAPPRDPSHETVTTDSAAVYSFNSTGSSIVHVLKKGDSVEKKLEVVDSKNRWQLIRAGDNWSGFVPSETLEGTAPRDNVNNLKFVR